MLGRIVVFSILGGVGAPAEVVLVAGVLLVSGAYYLGTKRKPVKRKH